jgi:tetratricopeptide (TPR) repeat protein
VPYAAAILLVIGSLLTFKPNQESDSNSLPEEITIAMESLQSDLNDRWLQRADLQTLAWWPEAGASQEYLAADLRRELRSEDGPHSVEAAARIRLAQATLALADQRYEDALRLATDALATIAKAGHEQSETLLNVQGDALFGLGRWQEARDIYIQLTLFGDDDLLPLIKVIQCLTNSVELDSDYQDGRELGNCLHQLALQLDLRGYSEAAFRQFEESLDVFWRIQSSDDNESVIHYTATLNNLGISLHHASHYKLALQQYDLAIEKLGDLVEQREHEELLAKFADVLSNRGSTYWMLDENDAAARDLDRSVEVLKQIIATKALPETIDQLVASLNLRAVISCELDQHVKAIRDYDQAIELIGQLALIQESGFSVQLGLCLANRAGVRSRVGDFQESKLDYDRAVDILSSQLILEYSTPLEIELANRLKDRGAVHLQLGYEERGLQDLERAAEILERHMRQIREPLLASSLAGARNLLARVYAEADDGSLQNAGKAVRNATQACDLSDWSDPLYIETLGVAVARAGDSATATKWQQRAMALKSRLDQSPAFP